MCGCACVGASDVPETLMIDYNNAGDEFDCAWYSRYPFNIDPSGAEIPLCMPNDLKVCTNMHNIKNPQGQGSGPCKRGTDGYTHGYVTISRVPMPLHLHVKLWDGQLRAWDGANWQNNLGLQARSQDGRTVYVPATAFAANTVDGNDWDAYYEQMGVLNPWRREAEWPAGVTTPNNVCLREEQQTFIVNGEPELIDVMAYKTCITWDNYQKILEDVPAAQNCNTCDAGASTDCMGMAPLYASDGTVCTNAGVRIECFRNVQSVSTRACELVANDICVNWNWLVSMGVLDDETRGAAGRSRVNLLEPFGETKFEWHIFNTADCTETLLSTGRGYASPDFMETVVIDTRSQSAKLALTSNAKENDWACDCSLWAESKGYDVNDWKAHSLESDSGLRKCMECTFDGVYTGRDLSNQGNCFDSDMCLQCPNDERHDGISCVPCPPDKPIRDRFETDPSESDDWKECGKCPSLYWYEGTSTRCQPVSTMILTSTGVKQKDFYRISESDTTKNGYSEVQTPYYRIVDRTGAEPFYTIALCVDYCDMQNEFKFAKWCGAHEYYEANVPYRDAYVIEKSQLLDAENAELWSNIIASVEDPNPNNYEILRHGKCELCTECPDLGPAVSEWGRYNSNCGENHVEPGTCEACSDPTQSSTCAQDKYVYHLNSEGCFGKRALSDYECGQCEFATVDAETNPERVMLNIGCGLYDNIQVWDLQEQLSSTKTCTYYDDDAEYPDKCSYPWTGGVSFKRTRTHPDYAKTFFNRTNAYQMRIPYCPPNHYFDTSACSNIDQVRTSAYDPTCCKQCRLPAAGYRRADSYRECPGYTTSDTQTFTRDCGAQTYTEVSTDPTADSSAQDTMTCRPCTVCEGESL